MKRELMGLVLVLGLVGSADAALVEDNSTNAEADATAVAVTSAKAAAVQGQVGINEQTSVGEVSIDTNVPKQKTLANGLMAPSVPQGNEGFAVQTPWGGPMITQGSPMAKYQALFAMGATEKALEWATLEAQPRKILGIKGSEKGCRNWLVNLLCF